MDKELFDMVYGWGRVRMVVDETAPAYKKTLRELKKQAAKEFVTKQNIIDKFETLAEYIPKQLQRGHVGGLEEEVRDFIEELRGL